MRGQVEMEHSLRVCAQPPWWPPVAAVTTDGALECPGPWACLLHRGSEQRPGYQHSRDGRDWSSGWSSDSGVKAQGERETEEPSNSVLSGERQAGTTAPSLLTSVGCRVHRLSGVSSPQSLNVLSAGLALVWWLQGFRQEWWLEPLVGVPFARKRSPWY